MAVEVENEAVLRFLDELKAKLEPDRYTAEIGELIKFRIKERTARGEDYRGRVFVPYTPAYARHRQKHGRPTDKVNLFFTGRMLAALDYRRVSNGVDIGFFDRTQAAKAQANQKRREFMGINSQDATEILKIIRDALD